MTREELLAMAEQAGLQDHVDVRLMRFHALAVAAAVAKEREECAKVCEKRAEARWEEYGVTESDTNASYYPDAVENEMGIRDEESDDCAKAIRARSAK